MDYLRVPFNSLYWIPTGLSVVVGVANIDTFNSLYWIHDFFDLWRIGIEVYFQFFVLDSTGA